ncbi:hypothetical protein H4R33_006952 [Dimargaris cristalligena]|nr:hypothetical protein H4R33_006952 [Dimargaris cristalligena]
MNPLIQSKKVFGLYLSRIPGSEIHISLRKLLQTGPLDKLAQLIYSFDSKYYIPNQVSGSNSEVGSPVIITQSIVKIPNLTNDQDRLRFLSPLLVYEGRSGLALDIAHARRQSPTDGSKLSTMEALKISEVTGFMILSDCLRAAILVNDVSAVGGFLLVDMTYKEDSQAGRDLGLFTWDDLELLGFFLMALRWKRYAAAGQLRIAVIPEIPGETVASSIAKRALDWFDRQGYQNPLDPLDFDDLLAPFPNYLLGQPDDYIFTKESQPKDLYYTVIDPTAFTRESALQKYRKLVNEPAPAPWAKPVSRLNNRSHSVSTSPTGRSARHSPALASPTWLRNRTNLTPIILDPATMDPSSSISTTTPPALPAVTESEQPQWLIDLQLAKAARAQATQVSSSSNEPNPDSERVEPPRPANLPNPTSGSVRSRIQQWSNMAPS